MTIQVGTARSQPGEIVYGVFDAIPLPTGDWDHFPVIIAQGRSGRGPVLWLTANVHGGEYNGVATLHRLLTPDLIAQLNGTVIAVPTLNPAGLRTGERSPYYLRGKDPNRLFPGLTALSDSPRYPSALEVAYTRLFERIDAAGDFLIDLHDFGILSIPFAFRDPVFYRESRDQPVARKLQDTLGQMLDALGLTVVNEFVSHEYLKINLHRTVSGAALNTARIPAFTLELSGQRAIHPAAVQAALSGIRNVMRWAGMLPGDPEPIRSVPVIKPGYPLRRTTHPRVPQACLVHHLVQPGDPVRAGDPVARMVDVYGRPIGEDDGLLRTEQDGFILGIFPGMAFYPNEPIIGMAIRDDNELVIPVLG